jgi:sugar lactone lactonase YvrE
MKSWTQRAASLLPQLTMMGLLLAFAAAAGAAVPPVTISSQSAYPATGLGGATNGAVTDQCGNVYAMDNGWNGGILYEIPFGGGKAVTIAKATGLGQGWDNDDFLYMDNAKANLYVQEGWGGTPAYKIPVVNCALNVTGMTGIGAPAGSSFNGYWWESTAIAADNAGDAFIATSGTTLFELAADGKTYTNLLPNKTYTTLPANITSMAVDGSNNIYFLMNKAVYELPYSAASSSYAATPVQLSTGYNGVKYTTPMGLSVDALGNLYVADQGPASYPPPNYSQSYITGAIYEIPNESTTNATTKAVTWALNPADEFVVVSGIGPQTAANLDQQGNFFFTTHGSSIYVATSGKANLGSVAAGTSAKSTLGVAFNAAVTPASLAFTGGGSFSSTANTCKMNTAATVGSSCTITAQFSPSAPGPFTGGLILLDGSSNVLAASYLTGAGLGAGVTLDPGAVSKAGSSFTSPKQIVVTNNGGYVVDSAQNAVLYFATPTAKAVVIGNGLSDPSGVAVDAFGNVLIADTGNNRIVEVPVVSGSPSTAAQVTISPVDAKGNSAAIAGAILSGPTGLTLDSAGNLYIADTGNNRIVLVPYSGGWNVAAAASIGSGLSKPLATAVDPWGNLYIANSGTGQIFELPAPVPGVAQQLVAVGYNNPSALATDASGSLFVVNQGAQTVLRIPRLNGALNPNGSVEVGLGIADPYGVAVDAAGNIYVTDSMNAAAYSVARTSTTDAFGDWAVSTASGALPIYLENAGNQPLTFATPYFTATGNTGDFSLSTTAANICGNGASLATGAGCELDATFQPTATGARSETVTINSNAVNSAAPQVVFSGSGIPLTATKTVLAVTSPATGTPFFGEPLTLTATVTAASGTPAGMALLVVDGIIAGEATANSSGVATFTLANGLTGGSHVLQAVYEGNSTFDGSTSSALALAIGTAPTTSTLAITVPFYNPYSIVTGTSVSFDVTVSSTGVGIPTGTITFATGSTTLGTVALAPAAGGTFQATLATTALPVGTDLVTATYSGDANYVASTTSVTVVVVAQPVVLLSTTGTTLTSSASGNSSITLNALTEGGWTGVVSYQCDPTTLPANALCLFAPAQVTVTPSTPTASYPLSSTQSTLQVVVNNPPNSPVMSSMLWWLGGLSGLVLLFVRRRTMRGAWASVSLLAGVVLLAISAAGLTACSSSNIQFATPKGTSTVKVYAYADPYKANSTTTQACGANASGVATPGLAPCSMTTYQISLTVQ